MRRTMEWFGNARLGPAKLPADEGGLIPGDDRVTASLQPGGGGLAREKGGDFTRAHQEGLDGGTESWRLSPVRGRP